MALGFSHSQWYQSSCLEQRLLNNTHIYSSRSSDKVFMRIANNLHSGNEKFKAA